MSEPTGDTGHSLGGDAEPVTGIADPPAAQPHGLPGPAAPVAQPQGPPGAPPPSPAAGPWAPAPDAAQDRRRAPRWRRITVMVLLLVIGLGATGTGGALLDRELTRHATPAEASAAGREELATLWQRWSAGQIFPRTLSYATGERDRAQATLIGIAPRSSCAAAADPAITQALQRAGCVTMLRATYADQSGTVMATAGIAVMTSPAAAQQAQNAALGPGTEETAGILAAGFPGAAFPEAAREVFGSEAGSGPYVFFYTAGYADGRSTSFEVKDGESVTVDLGHGLIDSLSARFRLPAKPCASKDITC